VRRILLAIGALALLSCGAAWDDQPPPQNDEVVPVSESNPLFHRKIDAGVDG
jgi:hypothetical protein